MSKFRVEDEYKRLEYEAEETCETIKEAAELSIQKYPFTALNDTFESLSREDLLNACMFFVRQSAELRDIMSEQISVLEEAVDSMDMIRSSYQHEELPLEVCIDIKEATNLICEAKETLEDMEKNIV